MTSTRVLDRRSVRVGYVVGAGVLALASSALSGYAFDLYSVSWVLSIVRVLYLGPLGIAAELGIVFPLTFTFAGSGGPVDVAATLVLSLGIAWANVVIVGRWRVRRRTAALVASMPVASGAGALGYTDVPGGVPGEGMGVPGEGVGMPGYVVVARERPWAAALGAVLLSLAGSAFILLCIVAGFAYVFAHGVDVPTPEAQARRTIVIAGISWCSGLVVAVTGLVLWIRRGRRGRPLLRLGIVVLAIQVGLIVVTVVGMN